jgi:chitinase
MKERGKDRRRILATSLILVAASLVEPVATQGLVAHGAGLVAAAYLPDYRLNGAEWGGLAAHLTDVILFSVEIGPRGDIEGLNRVREGLEAARRQKGRTPHLRVLLCIGGAGRSRGFPFVAFRSDDRKKFVGKLLDLCEEQGLDGIDFDWEGGAEEIKVRGPHVIPEIHCERRWHTVSNVFLQKMQWISGKTAKS